MKEAVATMKTGSAALAGQRRSNGKGNSKSGKAVTCPICQGSATVRRLESKKKKGVFFWSCSNREAHPLLADDHGKPGKPFGAKA